MMDLRFACDQKIVLISWKVLQHPTLTPLGQFGLDMSAVVIKRLPDKAHVWRSMKRSIFQSACFSPRILVALLLCAAAAGLTSSGTLLALSQHEAPGRAQRTLTFEERVSYQRAIEDVYWRHRIWPKENSNLKPSLDAVMSQAELEKKVKDYLRNSQALEDYWHRPVTAEQLQAEMDRVAQHTKQPGVLRELFEALGNDPFVIAECLARPALAERLVTSWYAYDRRIQGDLKQRAEAELQNGLSVEEMKQLSGKYSEIELVESDAVQGKDNHRPEHGLNLDSGEWNKTVQKLGAIFGDSSIAAGVSPVKGRVPVATQKAIGNAREPSISQIKTGVVSALQEDDSRYYATAILNKTHDHLKLATVSWLKEPFESWIVKAESRVPTATPASGGNYTLPKISEGGCVEDSWTATAGAPSARGGQTAVWTGTEMIIWGSGWYGDTSGGRYNPSTDTWAATSTTNAPEPRGGHTAVWTGGEMLVWAGANASGNFNTGGIYNPNLNGWAVINTANAPTARSGHTAVWTGTEMIVWGNSGDTSGGRYNRGTNSWTVTSTVNAPEARGGNTAVWTGTEMIVWGGFANFDPLNTGARYNPGTNSWTATSTVNAPTARGGHSAVWTGSEMIVWGGTADTTGGRYNPNMDSWMPTATAPAPRYLHTAVWTGSEMIVWGGVWYPYTVDTGGRYNPTTDSWAATSIINAPEARYDHRAVWTGSEMIVWGGWLFLNTGGKYNPISDSWTATTTANAPVGRYAYTTVWTGAEMIVWGGDDGNFDPLNTGGRYDPGTDSWIATSITNAPDARDSHTAIWTGSEMIVWGGAPYLDPSLNTGGRYNPDADSWTPTSTVNVPEARSAHTAVWTGTEMIVWGGTADTTGGRYNLSTDSWAATSIPNAPDARFYHTAVWTGTEMIIWGGISGLGVTNTGGRYDPNMDSWAATSVTHAPVARQFHTAVWTGNEMIVWGGDNLDFNPFNSGGRYCAQSGPTPTPSPTPTPCTARCSPTPRPRPTPVPRP